MNRYSSCHSAPHEHYPGHRSGTRFRVERGATLVEYAIAAAMLMAVFIVAGKVLLDASKSRGDASVGTVRTIVPSCGQPGGLSGDECL